MKKKQLSDSELVNKYGNQPVNMGELLMDLLQAEPPNKRPKNHTFSKEDKKSLKDNFNGIF